MTAVTFDFGQTLAELDHEMLVRRVAERGGELDVERVRAHTPAAWRAYGEAKRLGLSGHDAWCTFMRTLLDLSGLRAANTPVDRDATPSVGAELTEQLTEWLWQEQPARNLWRRPVPGMFELVRELVEQGVTTGIISNSEGKIAELSRELGIFELFEVIADSGVLGFEKPDPRIFHWTAERLAVPTRSLIHVGDAWEADVVGALGVGARAVWFAPDTERELPERVLVARDATELARVLRAALARS